MQTNGFASPTWLVDKKTLTNIDYAGYTERFRRLQQRHLNNLLSFERLGRMLDHAIIDKDNYTALQMLRDTRTGLWTEIRRSANVSPYRRNLQRAYIDRMGYLMTGKLERQRTRQFFNVEHSDIRALVRGELNSLRRRLQSVNPVNTTTRYHYADCIKRIEAILDPK